MINVLRSRTRDSNWVMYTILIWILLASGMAIYRLRLTNEQALNAALGICNPSLLFDSKCIARHGPRYFDTFLQNHVNE
jgi:hypothetical protein